MLPEIRDRVVQSAEELGYHVNLLGRALRKRGLNVVGLIVPDLSNPFFAALAEHLGTALRDAGFELLISSAEDDIDTERRAVESFLGQQIRALVVIPCDEQASAAALKLAVGRVPTVQFDRWVRDAEVPYVGCDNARGIQEIVRHVREVAEDERSVVFVGAGVASSSARERREAFEVLMPRARFMDGSFDVEWGRRAARILLDEGIRSATVVVSADVIALGLQSELQASGARIPQDFRVIGFDGVGVTGYALPALTTVRQPVEEMSRVILEQISGDASASTSLSQLVPPIFVVGASSPEVSCSSPQAR